MSAKDFGLPTLPLMVLKENSHTCSVCNFLYELCIATICLGPSEVSYLKIQDNIGDFLPL